MRPFLLLATRAEDTAAEEEYAAFLRFSGLQPPQLVRHRLEQLPLGPVDLDDWSGIVLGGSPFNTSDPSAAKSSAQHRVERELAGLLDEVVDRDFPFLGACYGVGTLGVHQGGVVDRTYGEPVGPAEVTLTPDGRADPLTGVLPERFEAFVGHKEAIRSLPDSATLLGSSPTCPVQAFRVRSNVYATQFHPELDLDGIILRIHAYANYGYFAADEVDVTIAAVRRAPVSEPSRMLRTFVELHAR